MWVTVGSGEGKGLSVRVEGQRFVVGSGEECQLMLSDPGASPLHAYFEVEESGQVMLHDLASQTGTFVNGERIEGPRRIEGGEEIRIGETLLTPSVADPAEEARQRAAAAQGHPLTSSAVRVTTEEGQTVEVTAAPHADEHGDEHPAVRVATEGEAVEVVPAGEHRRLRDRIRVATAVGAVAALLAVAGLVAFLATRGGDDLASTREIVADAKPRTVQIRANLPGGNQSGGSGFVLDASDGLVVTNYHVLNGAREYFVGVDGDIRKARIKGAAPCDDLAVLQVEDHSGMKDFPLGSQKDLKEGDPVVAVGYPANAGLSETLTSTAGVVSVVHGAFEAPPNADGPSYPDAVQTDAALNPGNSGGPLVDGHKRVVGVNAAVLSSAGGAPIQGQGYAIGIDRVKQVVSRLRTGKSLGWGGFGFGFPGSGKGGKGGGALVVPVPGSEADQMGLTGAKLTQINGARVENFGTYCDAVTSVGTGQTAVLTVVAKPGAPARQIKLRFL
jgi:S1-C subfamily serine protease